MTLQEIKKEYQKMSRQLKKHQKKQILRCRLP